jgi:hypothetical protein
MRSFGALSLAESRLSGLILECFGLDEVYISKDKRYQSYQSKVVLNSTRFGCGRDGKNSSMY